MPKRRIIIDFDPETLSATDLRNVNRTLAALHRMSGVSIRAFNRHIDAGASAGGIQPQTKRVLDYLMTVGRPVSTHDVGQELGMSDVSARAQLHLLSQSDMVTRIPDWKPGRSGQSITGWTVKPRS